MNQNNNGNKGATVAQEVSKEIGGVPTPSNEVKNIEEDERKQTANPFAKVPQIHVERLGIHRSVSVNSLASNASSVVSAFSNATADDLEYVDKYWDAIQALRKEEEEIVLPDIEKKIAAMNEACNVQRNVSMTIKNGIKGIEDAVNELKKKHALIKEAEEKFKSSLGTLEEARIARKRIRARIQGQLTKNAVIAATKSVKRRRISSESPSQDEGKKTKRKNRKRKKSRKEGSERELVKETRLDPPTKMVVKVLEGQTFASFREDPKRG